MSSSQKNYRKIWLLMNAIFPSTVTLPISIVLTHKTSYGPDLKLILKIGCLTIV